MALAIRPDLARNLRHLGDGLLFLTMQLLTPNCTSVLLTFDINSPIWRFSRYISDLSMSFPHVWVAQHLTVEAMKLFKTMLAGGL